MLQDYYNEDIYGKDVTGFSVYSLEPPPYNSKILYAIDISSPKNNENSIAPLAIEPLVNELFEDYDTFRFEGCGCPPILYFKKLFEEAIEKELNIDEYFHALEDEVHERIKSFNKDKLILEIIIKKYNIDTVRDEITKTQEGDKFYTRALSKLTEKQIEDFFFVYHFTRFYECMIFDIISFLYAKLARLRHFSLQDNRKEGFINDYKKLEEYMKENTPFTDWREWYDFLRKKHRDVYFNKIKDEAQE